MDSTKQLLALWKEGRTRFSNQLSDLSDSALIKKLDGAPNSAGFLIRHIAEVELLFAKNVFNGIDVKVHAKTLIDGKDTGEWTELDELLSFQQEASDHLKRAIESIPPGDWHQEIQTKEFGTKTRAEALGRIITHTAYHAGQLAIILKYGK